MSQFSINPRPVSPYAPHIAELQDKSFDLVIIGGGIVGCSAAREAAAAGYTVLLAEKDDFASGASGRSSRLLHCGLRYFEAPNPFRYFSRHPSRFLTSLKMARQAMRERREMALTSPERLRPVRFLFPIFSDGPYRPWQVDIAFGILGKLAPLDVPLNYRRLTKPEALKEPMIRALGKSDKLLGAASYTEYQFNWPERLCIDAILDAEAAGAVALNYTRARIGSSQGDRREVFLHGSDDTEVRVTARRVLAASGLWVDKLLAETKKPITQKALGTKGGHIVFKLPDEYRGQGITTVNSRNDPFYCMPWGDLHYIGPTETLYDDDLDNIRVNAEDLEFLLTETAALFPGFNLTLSDVISTWAGVRPLSFDPAHPMGNRSRMLHDLGAEGLDGVYAMTAAPIMSHRDTGRLITARLREKIAPSGQATPLDYRPHMPIENANAMPIVQGAEYTLADVCKAVRFEHARTLHGVLHARTGLALGRGLAPEEIERVADEMGRVLGWSEADRTEEIARYLSLKTHLYGVPGSSTSL